MLRLGFVAAQALATNAWRSSHKLNNLHEMRSVPHTGNVSSTAVEALRSNQMPIITGLASLCDKISLKFVQSYPI